MMDFSALSARQRRILGLIQKSGGSTRKEVAERLDLPLPTVTRIVSDLRDRGLLLEDAGPVRTARGRPNTTVRLRNSAAYAIGVDFDGRRWSWELCDANAVRVAGEGPILHREGISEASTAAIVGALRSAVAAAGVAWADVAIIVFAVHAIVAANGDIYESFDQRKRSFNINDVGTRVSEKPCVSNDPARMYMVVEYDPTIDHPDSAYVLYGMHGHGMGLMVCGKMLRTFNGISGEIGHLAVGSDLPAGTGDRTLPPLVDVSNGQILVAAAQASLWGRQLEEQLKAGLRVRDICDAARGGNPGAADLLCRHVELLAPALASTASLAGSETVVLGGEWTDSGETVRQHLVSKIETRIAGALSERLVVRYARNGMDAVVSGAAIFGAEIMLAGRDADIAPAS